MHLKSFVRSSMILMVILPHSRNHMGSFLCLLMCFDTLLFLFWSVCTLHPNLLYAAWFTYVGCLFFVTLCYSKTSFASCSSAFPYLTIGWVIYSLEVSRTSICPISYPTPVTPPHCTLCNAGTQVWYDRRGLANGAVEGQASVGKSYWSVWSPK